MQSKSRFICPVCGYCEYKDAKCSYTGILHGHGWVYRCPDCNGDLKFDNEGETDEKIQD